MEYLVPFAFSNECLGGNMGFTVEVASFTGECLGGDFTGECLGMAGSYPPSQVHKLHFRQLHANSMSTLCNSYISAVSSCCAFRLQREELSSFCIFSMSY